MCFGEELIVNSLKRAAFAATVALILFIASTESASALSMRISPGGAIAASGRVTFGGSSILSPECDLTLRGTLFQGPIEKIVAASVGQVTAAQITNCVGVESVSVLGLPWLIVYLGEVGTLTDGITSLRLGIAMAQFELRGVPLAGNCLYGGLMLLSLSVSGTNPYASGALPSLGSAAPLSKRGGGIFCPGSGWFDGSFILRPTETISLP